MKKRPKFNFFADYMRPISGGFDHCDLMMEWKPFSGLSPERVGGVARLHPLKKDSPRSLCLRSPLGP